MKFMKIGTKTDTFYTDEATRTVASDVSSDLSIRINNITFLLHKFQLLPKCGLLQQLCLESGESKNVTLELRDIPGGEYAFDLCAKFCYGITIDISAHNFVPAFCVAKFLGMTEAVEKGNLVLKLETFFNSCILEGWKDSIITLQTTEKLPDWSENLGIIRRCVDSVLEKILTPPIKVTWSYTYTRSGYDRKRHPLAPKDWWTEDISDLDIDLFRCIVIVLRSTNILPPQLIGEALHVYACRWLPDTTCRPSESSVSRTEQSADRKQRILETIVSMIPADRGSVSIKFILRLLSTATFLGVSAVTKAEIIRRSGQQFEEATLNDLFIPSHSTNDDHLYDIDLVGSVLGSFLTHWKRQPSREQNQSAALMRKVRKLIDSYLQVVAKDINMPVQKVVSLAETIPEVARADHADLYKAINIYLKEHPKLTKAEKKQLCRILDCQKLSPELCAHAVKNERLPLRKVVQVLFFEQERGSRTASHKLPTHSHEHLLKRQQTPVTKDDQSKLKSSPVEESSKIEGTRSNSVHSVSGEADHRLKKSDKKLQVLKKNVNEREDLEIETVKELEIDEEEGISKSKLDHGKIIQRRTRLDLGDNKGRER